MGCFDISGDGGSARTPVLNRQVADKTAAVDPKQALQIRPWGSFLLGVSEYIAIHVDAITEKTHLLNRQVAERTAAAVKACAKSGNPLPPEMIAAMRPKSLFVAGAPVHEDHKHSRTIFWMVSLVYVLYLGLSSTPVGLSLLAFVLMYLHYDFYSGLLHLVLDEPANLDYPLLGQACLGFQWHHHIPDDICKKGVFVSCGDLNGVIPILLVLNLIVNFASKQFDPLALTLTGFKGLMAYIGQYSHVKAHDIHGRNRLDRLLQNCGFISSVYSHQLHHKAPHNTNFSLLGWTNKVVDTLLTKFPAPKVHLIIFLALSCFDCKAIAVAVRWLVPQ